MAGTAVAAYVAHFPNVHKGKACMKKPTLHRVAPRRKPVRVARPQATRRKPAADFDVLHLQELAPPGSGPPGDPMTYDHVRIEDVPEEHRPGLERMLREVEAGDLCGIFRRPDGWHVILIRGAP
jgi:hypothetical protein